MTKDKHAGMGGSYVINEAGKKVLVHRTDHPSTSSGQAQPTATAPKKARPALVAEQLATKNKTEGEK